MTGEDMPVLRMACLCHPVILGLIWSLLLNSLHGQPETSAKESNKVYTFAYHFQHNGTTNSQEILKRVLGNEPEFGVDPSDGHNIIRTFSSPDIRGFFTKGVLPAGPLHGFDFGTRSTPVLDDIKKVVDSNLRPPNTGFALQPISPDISKVFSGDYNNVNDAGLNYQRHDDFRKPDTPTSFVFNNVNNDPPKYQPPALFQNNGPRNFDLLPPFHGNDNNNIGPPKVEKFTRDTPDGGKIEGRIETFSFNNQPNVDPNKNYRGNSEGFRRNENIFNNNNEVTGHRTQSYFRQQFRTIVPTFETENLDRSGRVAHKNPLNENNGNNQWWNVLNVLGDGNNNQKEPIGVNPNKPTTPTVNDITNSVRKKLNSVFGQRLTNINQKPKPISPKNERISNINFNSKEYQNGNKIPHNQNQGNNPPFYNRFNTGNMFRNPQISNNNVQLLNNVNNRVNPDTNFNNQFYNQGIPNKFFDNPQNEDNNAQFLSNVNNRANPDTNFNNQFYNQGIPNKIFNSPQNDGNYLSPKIPKDNYINHRNDVVNHFKNDDTTKTVLNIINEVSAELNKQNHGIENFGLTWDDDISSNVHHDWSKRHPTSSVEQYSNGPTSNINDQHNQNLVKTTIDALIGRREFPIPEKGNVDTYNHHGGRGMEKFYGVDKVVEGPKSFSRNSQRRLERNYHVNSNNGFQTSNQWSTNTLRRLDVQSSHSDFSKDFIDVFSDDY